MSELRQLQEEKAALELPRGENQFSESNGRTHGGKKKSEKGGRKTMPSQLDPHPTAPICFHLHQLAAITTEI